MHAYDFLQRYGPAAVVTGASSGIGEAFAVLLAREAIDNITGGPVFISGAHNREMFEAVTAMPRRDALLMMGENMQQVLD